MPAVSQAQQKFMAMAEHVPGFAKEHGIHMTHQQLHDFATGPEKQKPEHVHNGKAVSHGTLISHLMGK